MRSLQSFQLLSLPIASTRFEWFQNFAVYLMFASIASVLHRFILFMFNFSPSLSLSLCIAFYCVRTQYLFFEEIILMSVFFGYIKRTPFVLAEVRFIELDVIWFSAFSFKWKIIMWILAQENRSNNTSKSVAKRTSFRTKSFPFIKVKANEELTLMHI